jgi:hypothetical protein
LELQTPGGTLFVLGALAVLLPARTSFRAWAVSALAVRKDPMPDLYPYQSMTDIVDDDNGVTPLSDDTAYIHLHVQ